MEKNNISINNNSRIFKNGFKNKLTNKSHQHSMTVASHQDHENNEIPLQNNNIEENENTKYNKEEMLKISELTNNNMCNKDVLKTIKNNYILQRSTRSIDTLKRYRKEFTRTKLPKSPQHNKFEKSVKNVNRILRNLEINNECCVNNQLKINDITICNNNNSDVMVENQQQQQKHHQQQEQRKELLNNNTHYGESIEMNTRKSGVKILLRGDILGALNCLFPQLALKRSGMFCMMTAVLRIHVYNKIFISFMIKRYTIIHYKNNFRENSHL